MAVAVPTLSSQGWVRTLEEKADFALSYFFTSEYSQSTIYYGTISSLPYLIKMYGDDETELQFQVQEALEGLMRRYFEGDVVKITVAVKERNPEKPGQLTIQFQCIVREDGQNHSIGRRVEFLDGRLKQIIDLNNG